MEVRGCFSTDGKSVNPEGSVVHWFGSGGIAPDTEEAVSDPEDAAVVAIEVCSITTSF